MKELGHQVSLIRSVAKKVFSEMGSSLSYKIGTMIEIPRAALVADEVFIIFQFKRNNMLHFFFFCAN